MTVRMGAWNCAQCRTEGIRGDMLSCPLCGDVRNQALDPSEAPYLPENAQIITDSATLAYAASGPTWNCGGCGEPNQGTATTCGGCGQTYSGDDFTAPVTEYVDGTFAAGRTLDSEEDLEVDRVDATLTYLDRLATLEDQPHIQQRRTLPSSSLPRAGQDPYARSEDNEEEEQASPVLVLTRPQQLMHWVGARKKIVTIVLIILGALGISGGGATWFYDQYIATSTVDLEVTGLSWQRQIEVEEFRTLTLEGWTLPGDGRVLSQRQKVHHYEQVFDHYETRTRQVPETRQTGTNTETYVCGTRTVDNGNGTFSTETEYCTRTVPVYETVYRTETYQEPVYRDEPVYETWYVYQVDRWVVDHYDTSSGTTAPYWPEPTLEHADQRVGTGKSETYSVVLRDVEGRSFDRTTSLENWQSLEVGMIMKGEQTHQGVLVSVEGL